MDELEDKTAVVCAELESGGWVGLAALGVRTPFDVEADDCGGEGLGFEEPRFDVGGGRGEEGLDGEGGVDCDGVGVVGVVREVVVDEGNVERCWCGVWVGDWHGDGCVVLVNEGNRHFEEIWLIGEEKRERVCVSRFWKWRKSILER